MPSSPFTETILIKFDALPIFPCADSCFFFNDTATTEIYTLSLHDALPIWAGPTGRMSEIGLAQLPLRLHEFRLRRRHHVANVVRVELESVRGAELDR